jgi:hypothetical protein
MRSPPSYRLLLLLPFAACSYVDARLTDLGDCFIYRWQSEAFGVGADAKIGPASVVIGGWYSEYGYGKDTWWQAPGYTLTNHGTGIPFTTLGPIGYGQNFSRFFATGTTGNHVADPKGFDDVTSWLFVSDVFDLDNGSPYALTPAQKVVDMFGVEVGLAPLFLQAHVGFNVAEFVDFTLGIFYLDIFGDDGVRRPPTLPYVPEGR